MDPISQGLLGAVVPQCVAKEKELRQATFIGCLGGMGADLDILIRSSEDQLLSIEFHRHFTHSLLFIPFGGLIVALLLWYFFKERLSFGRLYLFATLGYATSGLLDACTSYGTRLLWPFSDQRIAWNNIAIIDPVFTLTLAVVVIITCVKQKNRMAKIGLSFCLCYLLFGVIQRDRAEAVLYDLAKQRGHEVKRLTAKPSIFNLILWRGIYETEDAFYVDAIRVCWDSKIYHGSSIQKFHPERDLSLAKDSVLFQDIERFAHFSDNYMIQHPTKPLVLGDLRYSLLPHEILPLWGIEVDVKFPTKHAPFQHYRNLTKDTWRKFFIMLRGASLSETKE